MKKLPLSYIELSKENLIHNIKQFRSLLRKGTKVVGVVKANAYGHGEKEVVKILNSYVDYFQINSIEELESVRSITKKPVLVLGYVGKDDIARAIKLGSILSVFDLHHALLINNSARKLNVKVKVHIAVDACLGREGVMPEKVGEFLEEIKKMKNIVVDGVYAHFSNIEDTTDFSYAERQIKTYDQALITFSEHGYGKINTHISATSGVLSYEMNNGFHPLVRIGVGLYGMWPSEDLKKKWQGKKTLKPAMRFVTHVAQVKNLPKDHSIGYGLTYVTERPTMIAVIPVGYSNGFPRLLSNKGEVLIKGLRAPVLGRVAMNMFAVDISHIKDVMPEDEVVILGTQGKGEITAEELAIKTDTINYEVTTRISPLLPRIVK